MKSNKSSSKEMGWLLMSSWVSFRYARITATVISSNRISSEMALTVRPMLTNSLQQRKHFLKRWFTSKLGGTFHTRDVNELIMIMGCVISSLKIYTFHLILMGVDKSRMIRWGTEKDVKTFGWQIWEKKTFASVCGGIILKWIWDKLCVSR